MIEAKVTVMLDASPVLVEQIGAWLTALKAIEDVRAAYIKDGDGEDAKGRPLPDWMKGYLQFGIASSKPEPVAEPSPAEPEPALESEAIADKPAKRRGRPPKKQAVAEPAPIAEPEHVPEPAPATEPANDNAEPEPEPATAEPVQAEPAPVAEPAPAQAAPASDDPMCGMSVVDAVAALVKDIQSRGIEMADVNARVRAKATEIGLTYASAACLIKAIGYQEARKVALGEK